MLLTEFNTNKLRPSQVKDFLLKNNLLPSYINKEKVDETFWQSNLPYSILNDYLSSLTNEMEMRMMVEKDYKGIQVFVDDYNYQDIYYIVLNPLILIEDPSEYKYKEVIEIEDPEKNYDTFYIKKTDLTPENVLIFSR